MKRRYILLASILSLASLHGFAWGQKGHDVTAFIAEKHLTPKAIEIIDSLFDGKSIVYYSNWLDNASHTPQYEYSKTWHYKNIDAEETFETATLNESGDIVSAIYLQKDILQDPNSTKEEKALALKMLVHFLGDIHQPMHLGHASDLGGNRHIVKYFGRDSNLHSVWDSSLPESAHKWSYTEWQQQIDRVSDSQFIDIIKSVTPESWAKETFMIATDVYDRTPEETKISYDYIAEWTPIVETQFLKGGLRLAHLLNTIFDEGYNR